MSVEMERATYGVGSQQAQWNTDIELCQFFAMGTRHRSLQHVSNVFTSDFRQGKKDVLQFDIENIVACIVKLGLVI